MTDRVGQVWESKIGVYVVVGKFYSKSALNGFYWHVCSLYESFNLQVGRAVYFNEGYLVEHLRRIG